MTSPNKKRRTASSITSLPEDLLLSCLARVSRLDYPILSLVSKRFHSLLTSPELFQTRSLIGRTESCLYVCLRFSSASTPQWFTLCRRPNQTLTSDARKTKKKSSGYALAPISITSFTQARLGTLIAVGSTIYNIGRFSGSPSSTVSILDCQTHTWHEAPSMQVERNYPGANFFDGKIYVAGGPQKFDSSNWMEVFDLKTQAWEFLSNPFAEKCCRYAFRRAVIEGKIYMHGKEDIVAYMPKEDRWELIQGQTSLGLGWSWFSYCVIDDVLYSYCDSYGIKRYDFKIRAWVSLKGLEGVLNFGGKYVEMVDYGGKMAVLWDNTEEIWWKDICNQNRMIWCAVIALERHNSEEIWGNVEWFDLVLEVPKSFEFVSVLSATV